MEAKKDSANKGEIVMNGANWAKAFISLNKNSSRKIRRWRKMYNWAHPLVPKNVLKRALSQV